VGYKNKADITSMFGANRKIVEDELAKKNEEYHNDEEIKKIAKQFETEKVRLKCCSQAKYLLHIFLVLTHETRELYYNYRISIYP
jgi:hypothetical protein